MAELSELGAEMDEASDQEDYEKAAELFEAITTCTAQLEQVGVASLSCLSASDVPVSSLQLFDQVLEALGCTREELLREQ